MVYYFFYCHLIIINDCSESNCQVCFVFFKLSLLSFEILPNAYCCYSTPSQFFLIVELTEVFCLDMACDESGSVIVRVFNISPSCLRKTSVLPCTEWHNNSPIRCSSLSPFAQLTWFGKTTFRGPWWHTSLCVHLSFFRAITRHQKELFQWLVESCGS